jgi:hypothetical protein
MLIVLFTWIFWFFIVRRASNIARWIFAILVGLSLLTLPLDYGEGHQIGPVYVWVSIILIVAQGIAAALLFRKDATEWIKNKGYRPDFEDVFS